jgi:hypothetical protein
VKLPGFLRVLVLAGLLAACGKDDAPNPAAAAPPAPAPALPPAHGESPLDILASANGSVEPRVTTDFPIVVEVDIFLKRSAGASLTLSNPSGPWSDAIKLECKGPDDADWASLFSPVFVTTPKIELTPERPGKLVWILDGAGASALPEGTWTIRAVVDESRTGGALPAGLASSPVTVIVTPAPTGLTPGAAQRKCLAVMNAATWKKDAERALEAANAHLAKSPEDVAVLFQKGQVLRAQGKRDEALAAFEASLQSARKSKDPMAENFAIERAIRELHRALQR